MGRRGIEREGKEERDRKRKRKRRRAIEREEGRKGSSILLLPFNLMPKIQIFSFFYLGYL